MKKQALGKGLKAFLPEEYGIFKEERFLELDIDQLRANPSQPRTKFDETGIRELADSIKETGILQPIVAIPDKDHYKIIVGERRWRAAQKIGLKKVPVLIRNMSRELQLEVSLIENLQREDLNPIEIAMAYKRMAQELGCTQKEIAGKVGKDRASVANYMRLLKLPQEIQTMLSENQISMGHARALIALESPEIQVSLARRVVKKNLSVRDVEKAIARINQRQQEKARRPKDPNLLAFQEEIIQLLSTKVTISGDENKGILKIYYHSTEELNRIYEKMKGVKK